MHSSKVMGNKRITKPYYYYYLCLFIRISQSQIIQRTWTVREYYLIFEKWTSLYDLIILNTLHSLLFVMTIAAFKKQIKQAHNNLLLRHGRVKWNSLYTSLKNKFSNTCVLFWFWRILFYISLHWRIDDISWFCLWKSGEFYILKRESHGTVCRVVFDSCHANVLCLFRIRAVPLLQIVPRPSALETKFQIHIFYESKNQF